MQTADTAVLDPSGVVTAALSGTSRGEFTVHSQARDVAGNVDTDVTMTWWVDAVAPAPPRLVATPAGVTALTSATFQFQLLSDTSVGQLSFVYSLTRDGEPYVVGSGGNPTIPDPTPTNNNPVQLTISGLLAGSVYGISVWSVSHSGIGSITASTFQWRVITAAPSLAVTSRPDADSGSGTPLFHFVVDWASVGVPQSTSGSNVSVSVALLGDVDLGGFHTPPSCHGGDGGSSGSSELLRYGQRDCVSGDCGTGSGCDYVVSLPAAGTHTLQAQAVLSGTAGPALVLQWSYVRCNSMQYGVISGNDTLVCVACPSGGDCSTTPSSADEQANSSTTAITAGSSVAAVTQSDIVAQAGWWASDGSSGLVFYKCAIAEACLSGGNGSRARCRAGYVGIACSVCADGYFEQFGKCALCPSSSGASIGALLGIVVVLVVACGGVYAVRALLPVDVLKLGLSMLQVRRVGRTIGVDCCGCVGRCSCGLTV